MTSNLSCSALYPYPPTTTPVPPVVKGDERDEGRATPGHIEVGSQLVAVEPHKPLAHHVADVDPGEERDVCGEYDGEE